VQLRVERRPEAFLDHDVVVGVVFESNERDGSP
jgi:hypothetical protein